jgi:hypothetical protein
MLPLVYGDIRSRVARDAHIVVLGYPQILPDPAAITDPSCRTIGISTEEYRFLRRKNVDLNNAIQDAANAAGVVFVNPITDPRSNFNGHELCTTDPWFNNVLSDVQNSIVGSFHPNACGQLAYARLASFYLTGRELQAC